MGAPRTGPARIRYPLVLGRPEDASSLIDMLVALDTSGFIVRTPTGWTSRTLVPPAAGLTIINASGVAGNPTFQLTNDLAGLESLNGVGFAKRTGADTWKLVAGLSFSDIVFAPTSANLVFAGPATGAASAPAFRSLVSADLPQATETAKGAAEIATQPETDAGLDDERIVTSLKLLARKALYRDFNTTSGAPAYLNGRMFWDDAEHCPAFFNDVSDVTMQIGRELWIRAKNNTGSPISNGTPVYVSGGAGNRPTIALASATSLATCRVVGLVTHDVANGQDCEVTIIGTVHQMNTNAWNVGDDLYLSVTSGQMQTTPPAEPAVTIYIGKVIVKSAANGEVLVNVRQPILPPSRRMIIALMGA